MTENKRFKIVDEQFLNYYGGTGYKISNEECCFWLWHNKNESQKVCDKLNSILDENEQLKKQKARYKRLSDIRNEEINNRILTIKEFIDNCSNEKVKKALEDLFYSEVNEYDLSKKYRKLHDKYKKLQLENNGLKYALKYIKKIDVEIEVDDFND